MSIERFMALFQGSPGQHGETYPDPNGGKGDARTVKGPAEGAHYMAHLRGSYRLGVVPVDEHGMSWFGLVDVDNHEAGKDTDIVGLEALVRRNNFPAVVVQTRRGGAHVIVLGKEPLPAVALIALLEQIRQKVKNFGNPIEIFPKQKKLTGTNLGSWVHLPYNGGDEGNCYAVHEGQPVPFEEFLDLAEHMAIGTAQLHELVKAPAEGLLDISQEAPPCLQQLMEEGVGEGFRNNALYNLAVMGKKAGLELDDLVKNLSVWNKAMLHPPAPLKDVKDIARRISQPGSHNYLCDQDPICSRCDKTTCGDRKWGWRDPYLVAQFVDFSEVFVGLHEVEAEPPLYYLILDNGKRVKLDAEEMFSFTKVRVRVLQQGGKALPAMKAEKWDKLMRHLFEGRTTAPAPTGANQDFAVMATLITWCRNSEEVNSKGAPHLSNPDDLLKGRPVVMLDQDTGAARTYFLPEHFEQELKRRKVTGYDGRTLWAVLSKQGIVHERLKGGLEAWSKPFSPYQPELEVPAAPNRF